MRRLVQNIMGRHKKGQALRRCSGQATTELAIMGSVVIMLLAYLLQQGFSYNSRQALEMYTFRKALEMSRGEERGISLTTVRDVFIPSFFGSLSRQRLQATASVEYNPWKVYTPDVPQDVEKRQLLQIGEGMIRNGAFIEVPPTKIMIRGQWQWSPSVVKELDAQTNLDNPRNRYRTTDYTYSTTTTENNLEITNAKRLQAKDIVPMHITFEDKNTIIENSAFDDTGDGTVVTDVDDSTRPQDVNMELEETVAKDKTITTRHHNYEVLLR